MNLHFSHLALSTKAGWNGAWTQIPRDTRFDVFQLPKRWHVAIMLNVSLRDPQWSEELRKVLHGALLDPRR